MRYIRQPPAVALRDSVDHLWSIADGPAYPAERILPTGTTELVINLSADVVAITNHSGSQRYSGAAVSGPYTGSFDIDAREHTAMIGVHFKPGGVRAVLGVAPHELLDAHVDLDALWGRAAGFRDRICEATSTAQRLAIVEAALLAQFRDDRQPAGAVSFAMDALRVASHQPSIATVARDVGLSHRRLIQLFTEQIGMSPKRFARLHRFRHAHAAVCSAPASPHWSTLAIEHGYADQSHMIREFQEFSGMTPAEQLRRRGYAAKDDHIALEP